MNSIKTLFVATVFFMVSSYSFGQVKAEKYDNPQWVSMSYIKFKPMKKEPAMGIIENYFGKADQDAGIDAPTVYHFVNGDYDMLVIWNMKEGVETLNYKTTPDDAKWMNSMTKIAGGPDKAMAKLEEFMTYVQDWDNTMARKE
ncbi:hypothetical protein [Christiangramia echinicola]|uniref:NIPSNAP protein n=1 Tax=Christiangramia echinicola TaxID=279359 RepID=A0A1H1LN80_9FLAO|nr:hypothetical protein [Christiangramia echinicola]SDR75966.1 hypothetical protein SAMN04488552_0901 [Christiangramia echinicola]